MRPNRAPSPHPFVSSLLLISLLVASPARAGAPAGASPGAAPAPDERRPDPHVATSLASNWTVLPVAAGTGLLLAARSANERTGASRGAGILAAAGAGVALFGVVVGPSVGYDYGGIPARGTGGLLLRAGTIVLPATLLATSQGVRDDGDTALAIVVGGVAGFCVASLEAVYDIGVVGDRVRANNESLAHPTSVQLGPAASPASHAPGMALTLRF